MDRFVKCSLVFGALGIAFGGCGGDEHITMPITTGAGTGAPISGTGASTVAGTGAGTGVAGAAGSTTTATPPPAGAGGTSGAPASASGGTGAGMGAAGVSAGSGAAGAQGGAGAAGASAGSGAAGAQGGAAGAAGAASGGNQTLPAVTDYTQKGPFKTTVTPNAGPGSAYTIYRPDPLGADGFQHSPMIFGPGIATSCAPGGALNIYTDLLNHFASHGYVVICVNSMTGGPGAAGNLTAMKMGLDWLIAQNSAAGVFQGKLAEKRAITMGYSIGATGSMQLASHEAIMTTVAIHGHMQMTSGKPHGPALLMTGTNDVIAQVRATIAAIDTAPMVMTALPIGHLDVPAELAARGRYVAPITAWLRYWVNGDQAAKSYFTGADCKMCTSPWIAPESNAKWKAQMF